MTSPQSSSRVTSSGASLPPCDHRTDALEACGGKEIEVTDAPPPIGHNNPPEPTPFEAFETHIGDLLLEAGNWLDGSGVASEADADNVSKLLSEIRAAAKDADKARAAEKKPHDDAAKAVQARWKPLLDRATLAADTCKKALSPWLKKKEDEQRAAAEKARAEAEAKAAEARAKLAEADAANLAAREDAERALKEADRADMEARRAEKAKAHATGGSRAIGLRSHWRAVVTDPQALAAHYWRTRRAEVDTFFQSLADGDVARGARAIPGVEVIEERTAA